MNPLHPTKNYLTYPQRLTSALLHSLKNHNLDSSIAKFTHNRQPHNLISMTLFCAVEISNPTDFPSKIYAKEIMLPWLK